MLRKHSQPVRNRVPNAIKSCFQSKGSFSVTVVVGVLLFETEVRDPVAIQAVCQRLRLPEAVFGSTKLFSTSLTGWAVQLPEWRYPVVCEVETGRVSFDNYEGRWGNGGRLVVKFSFQNPRSCQASGPLI